MVNYVDLKCIPTDDELKVLYYVEKSKDTDL